MRAASRPVRYGVGTPRGRLTRLQKQFLKLPWKQAQDFVQLKRLPQQGEEYLLALRQGRRQTERARRPRRLQQLCKRRHQLQRQKRSRDDGLLPRGAAQAGAGNAWRRVGVCVPPAAETADGSPFSFSLHQAKRPAAIRSEGGDLLRSNDLSGAHPAILWPRYRPLTEIEEAFRHLPGDRSIQHRTDSRIEAHSWVAFLAYGLPVRLRQRLRA